MNFLAHIFLSCDNEDLLIGNFIADFLRNKDVEKYSPSIQKGIVLHRQIDSYTDKHPVVLKGVHRLQEFHSKYAPVVIDIIYDYLLAINWSRYSGQSLDAFAKYIYEILNDRMDEMPMKLQKRLPEMIAGNWLQAYGTREGMLFTLKKMDERTSFPSRFSEAMDHLDLAFESYNAEFKEFFPEVIQYVDEHCSC